MPVDIKGKNSRHLLISLDTGDPNSHLGVFLQNNKCGGTSVFLLRHFGSRFSDSCTYLSASSLLDLLKFGDEIIHFKCLFS